MATSDTRSDAFLSDRFLDLPWPILKEIFLYLSTGFVYKTFMRVPKCQDFMSWYAQDLEVHIISKNWAYRSHLCQMNPDPRCLDLTGYDDIHSFFDTSPGLIPKCIQLHITNSSIMTNMLQTYGERIARASRLDIISSNCNTPVDVVETLLTFDNLSLLRLLRGTIHPWYNALSRLLPLLQSLRSIDIELLKLPPLSNIQLPPFLESLTLCIRGFGSEVLRTAEILSHVFAHPGGPRSGIFRSLMFPECLRSLQLDTESPTVNISLLPPKLERLHLVRGTKTLLYDGISPRWPQSLRCIHIRCHTGVAWLEQLSRIPWPPILLTLLLENPALQSFNGLELPVSLKHLELDGGSFSIPPDTRRDTYNLYEYPCFKFPDSLVLLALRNCNSIDWEEGRSGRRIALRDRITFPPTLESLDLSGCRLRRLAYFAFPPSLKTLILKENQISNLNTYNLYSGKTQIVHWSQLVHLRKLSVRLNKLRNLNQWYPPKSLRKLDLIYNKLRRLVPKITPLFQVKCAEITNQLQELNLSANKIEEIGSTLYLPRNLLILNLSLNPISEFQFFDALASHESLYYLNLQSCPLRRILTCSPGFPHKSNLKKLNLVQDAEECEYRDEDRSSQASTIEFDMTADEIYSVLELIGLTPTDRSEPIEREHLFHSF